MQLPEKNYAASGNTKTDASTYSYLATKPNAVSAVSNAGTVIPLLEQLISYTPFLQPHVLTENNYELTYIYGADYERIKGVLKQNNALMRTRYYTGAGYEKDIVNGGANRDIHYIDSPAGLIAIVVRENGSDTYHYVYTDHLGSILTLTDAGGTIEAEQNFDAWGRRRNASSWAYTGVVSPPDWLYRGYTGHEHLDPFVLINMNGRIYDPVVGRVLSPDNFVQDPFSTQNFNRYSYVLNNPLRYTNPDGNLIFIIPHISFGLEIGIGIPGVLSASVTGGYNFGSGTPYWSIQGYAGGVYAGYGSSGGFAGVGHRYAGFGAGVGYGSSGWNVGIGYGGTSNNFNGAVGIGWSEKGEFDWNISGGYTHNFVADKGAIKSHSDNLLASIDNNLLLDGRKNVPGGEWDFWGEGYVPYEGNAIGGTNFIGPGPDADPYALKDPKRPNKFLEPIDRIDKAAQAHDKAYLKAMTGGVKGALSNLRVSLADAILTLSAEKIMRQYNSGSNSISPRTYNLSRAVYYSFYPITGSKFYRMYSPLL